jgi:hypothetical protein
MKRRKMVGSSVWYVVVSDGGSGQSGAFCVQIFWHSDIGGLGTRCIGIAAT